MENPIFGSNLGQIPTTRYQVLRTKCLVPETWYQVLGTKYLVPSTWYQVPGIWPKFEPKIGFSKIWPILCHPALKMLRISPRSFLAWFWSLLFLTVFWSLDFPGMFSPKRGTWQGWRRRRGRRRPPVGGPRPQKYKNMDFGGLGGGGALPPSPFLSLLYPYRPL